jgi:hypothetical protein
MRRHRLVWLARAGAVLGALAAVALRPSPATAEGGCTASTCVGTLTGVTAAGTVTGFSWLNTPRFYESISRRPPGCPGCVWITERACSSLLEIADQVTCVGGQLNCPAATPQVVVYLKVDPTPRSLVDFYCPTRGGAPPMPQPIDLAGQAHRALDSLSAPLPVIGTSPPANPIVGLATYVFLRLADDRPSTSRPIDGHPELVQTITLRPTQIHWDFGDGDALDTLDQGAPFPDGAVTHSYDAVGPARLGVAQTWEASQVLTTPYGPLVAAPLDQAVVSASSRALDVGQVRSTLVVD